MLTAAKSLALYMHQYSICPQSCDNIVLRVWVNHLHMMAEHVVIISRLWTISWWCYIVSPMQPEWFGMEHKCATKIVSGRSRRYLPENRQHCHFNETRALHLGKGTRQAKCVHLINNYTQIEMWQYCCTLFILIHSLIAVNELKVFLSNYTCNTHWLCTGS